MIPTYNEAENIEELIRPLLNYSNIEIIVFDDNSPDGTWKIVDRLAKSERRVHLFLRKNERGRGSVEVAMMRYSLKKNADLMIEMDADLSHDPHHIPKIIDGAKTCDIVIGSRFIKGGVDVRGDPIRSLVTSVYHLFLKSLLGINLTDPSSGYRGFTKRALNMINFGGISVKGTMILTEVLYACIKKGAKVCETPIVFKNRSRGTSKLVSPLLLIRYALEIIKMKIFSRA